MGFLDDAADSGLIGGIAAGAQGFLKGMNDAEERADRREDRKLKKMEMESKFKADSIDREKKRNEDNFNHAGKLRDDWLKNQTTKNSQSVQEAYKKIQTAPPTAAGDMSLIYGFMRMQDPGSTVREGEFATAQNAASIPDRIRNMYNRVVSGERLNPDQRRDFVNTAGRLYGAQQQSQAPLDEQFRGLSEKYGISPDEVVLKIFDDPQSGQKVVAPVNAQTGQVVGPAKPMAQQTPQPKAKGLINKKPIAPKSPNDFDKMSDEELKAYINGK